MYLSQLVWLLFSVLFFGLGVELIKPLKSKDKRRTPKNKKIMHSSLVQNVYYSDISQLFRLLFSVSFLGFVGVSLVPVGLSPEVVFARQTQLGCPTGDVVHRKGRWPFQEVWVKDVHLLLRLARHPLLWHGLILKEHRVVGMLASLRHRQRELEKKIT